LGILSVDIYQAIAVATLLHVDLKLCTPIDPLICNGNRLAEAEARERKANELKRLWHRVEEEEHRVHELEQSAENWSKAKRIREYVLTVIDEKKHAGEELGPDTPAGIWVVWALQQADRWTRW
jgi:hypothetical protein